MNTKLFWAYSLPAKFFGPLFLAASQKVWPPLKPYLKAQVYLLHIWAHKRGGGPIYFNSFNRLNLFWLTLFLLNFGNIDNEPIPRNIRILKVSFANVFIRGIIYCCLIILKSFNIGISTERKSHQYLTTQKTGEKQRNTTVIFLLQDQISQISWLKHCTVVVTNQKSKNNCTVVQVLFFWGKLCLLRFFLSMRWW